MATPADQRLLELMDKWLKSLELHAKYSSLDDDSYWKVQPWMEHQRPSRWIIDLAMQKTLALRTHIQERVKIGDTRYSDSLELMIFLANLVGSEHIERFIPMADAQNERSLERTAPAAAASPPVAAGATTDATTTVAVTATATGKWPAFVTAKRAPHGRDHHQRRGRDHRHPRNAQIRGRQTRPSRRRHGAGGAHRAPRRRPAQAGSEAWRSKRRPRLR